MNIFIENLVAVHIERTVVRLVKSSCRNQQSSCRGSSVEGRRSQVEGRKQRAGAGGCGLRENKQLNTYADAVKTKNRNISIPNLWLKERTTCRDIRYTELYLIYLEIVLSHLVSQKCVAKNMADFGQIYVILTSQSTYFYGEHH